MTLPDPSVTTTIPPVTTTPPAEPGPVPYARFKEINDEAKTLKQRLDAFEAEQKTAKEKELVEQKKWQDLYENTTKELATEKQNNLRLKVASSKGLPIELVDRLRGETEEEITKDADGLLSLLKVDTTKRSGIPPIKGNGDPLKFDFASESDPAKIREAARAGK